MMKKKYRPMYKCLCCNHYMEREHNLPPLVCGQCGERLWTIVLDGTPVIYRDKCVLVNARKTILGYKEKER